MQSAITRRLILAIILLGFLAVAPMASAQQVVTNHSGTICKNYNAGEVSYIDYLFNGTRVVTTTSPTAIICPLTRNTANVQGAMVHVDVTHNGNQTTTCLAFSSNIGGGTLLASGSEPPWTGSGSHRFNINLVGPGKSSVWSDYSVLCTIPGNAGGVINGVDLYEY